MNDKWGGCVDCFEDNIPFESMMLFQKSGIPLADQ